LNQAIEMALKLHDLADLLDFDIKFLDESLHSVFLENIIRKNLKPRLLFDISKDLSDLFKR